MRTLLAACCWALILPFFFAQEPPDHEATVPDETRDVFFYDRIGLFSEGRAAIENDRKHGFIDEHGLEIVAPRYEAVLPFQEGLAAVRLKGKWGYIDPKGREVIAPSYDSARSFSEGLAAVNLGGRWGYIDRTGQLVIAAAFKDAYDFSEDLARIVLGGVLAKYGFIDRQGNEVVPPQYSDASDFSEGLAAVKSGLKWGYIDRTGRVAIPLEYAHANSFVRGRATVETIPDGTWILIDPERHILKSFASDRFAKGILHIAGPKEGFAITTVNVFAAAMRAGTIPGTAAPHSTFGLITDDGNVVIGSPFADVREVSNGFASFRTEKGWGLFQLFNSGDRPSGSTLIPAQYLDVTNANPAGFVFVRTAPKRWLRINWVARNYLRSGIARMRSGDHHDASRYFEKAATLGDPTAMGNLGYLYLEGLGVDQDDAKAAKWLTQGAVGGNVQSMVNLAALLVRSNRKDEAVAWLEKAQTLGHPKAKAARQAIERAVRQSERKQSPTR